MRSKSKSKHGPERKQRSTVRHTRAIQHDRTKRPNSAPLDSQMTEHLTQLLHPATFAQVAHFHGLGLRQRVLTLPVMVAVVLTLTRTGRQCLRIDPLAPSGRVSVV